MCRSLQRCPLCPTRYRTNPQLASPVDQGRCHGSFAKPSVFHRFVADEERVLLGEGCSKERLGGFLVEAFADFGDAGDRHERGGPVEIEFAGFRSAESFAIGVRSPNVFAFAPCRCSVGGGFVETLRFLEASLGPRVGFDVRHVVVVVHDETADLRIRHVAGAGLKLDRAPGFSRKRRRGQGR